MGFDYERIFPENGEHCGRLGRIGACVLLCWKEHEMFLTADSTISFFSDLFLCLIISLPLIVCCSEEMGLAE